MDSTLKSVLFWLAIIVAAFGIYQYSNARIVPGTGQESKAMQVAGEWHLGGLTEQVCAIFREGGVLLVVNERGDMATARLEGGNRVVVVKGAGWEPGATAELRENGRVLAWRDGSVWLRP